MAYSAPSSRAVGFLVTAAIWNQDVKDNIIFLHDTPAARVYHNATQNVSHLTATALAMNSEQFDNDTIHDTATNNSRLTCQTAGVYLISGHFAGTWEQGKYAGWIRFNGTSSIAQREIRQNSATSTFQALSISTLYKLSATNYVELVCLPNTASTSAITIDAGSGSNVSTCAIGMDWIGAGT